MNISANFLTIRFVSLFQTNDFCSRLFILIHTYCMWRTHLFPCITLIKITTTFIYDLNIHIEMRFTIMAITLCSSLYISLALSMLWSQHITSMGNATRSIFYVIPCYNGCYCFSTFFHAGSSVSNLFFTHKTNM